MAHPLNATLDRDATPLTGFMVIDLRDRFSVYCFACHQEWTDKKAWKADPHQLGTLCPLLSGERCPNLCFKGECNCVNGSLTRIGCDDCRHTGICRRCKGTGDAHPPEPAIRHWRNAVRREQRRRQRHRLRRVHLGDDGTLTCTDL